MRTFKSTLVVFCALLLGINAIAQEMEPNNNPQTASVFMPNSTSPGTLDILADPIDWYTATIPMSGNINLIIPPYAGLDVVVNVYISYDGGATLQQLDSVNAGIAGQTENINATGIESGLYYIKIQAIEGAGNYTLISEFTPQTTAFLFDDFEDGDLINNLQAGWGTFNDNSQGGASAISLSVGAGANASKFGISVNYTLNIGTLTYDPYVGIGSSFNTSGSAIDLSSSTGISFLYKGPTTIVQLGTANITDFSYYQFSIPESLDWTLYSITWSEFAQPVWGTPQPFDLSQAQNLNFQITGTTGASGLFQLDDIQILNFAPIQVESISFNNNEYQIDLNQNYYLEYSLFPTNALNQNVTFSSSNPDVVSVSQTGEISGLTVGSAIITVTSQSNPNVFASTTVTVVRPPLVAGFSSDYTTGFNPLVVQYNNYSTGIINSWQWDLNGDNVIDSYDQNPTFTYSSVGVFDVKLIISDGQGAYDSIIKKAYIHVENPGSILVDFTSSSTTGYVPMGIYFYDNSYGASTINSWAWDFNGDGITDAIEQSPYYEYTTPGLYNVTLTVTDINSNTNTFTKQAYINIESEPVQAYISYNSSGGYAPLTVQFSDNSTGVVVTRFWDFNGDGITDSQEMNPTFTYTTPGTYNVTLTVSNAFGSTSSTNVTISAYEDTRDKYCQLFVPATLGANYMDFATANLNTYNQTVKWYSYTANSNTRVKVDLCNSGYTAWAEVFDVYSGCDYTLKSNDVKLIHCNSVSGALITVSAGETIYFSIVADGNVNNQTGIPFVVSEVPIQQGDICSLPIPAILGLNSANTTNGDSWFNFTSTATGYIEVSTCGTTTLDTYLEVYKGCGNLWSNDDNSCGAQSKNLIPVQAGETIQIAWKDYNSQGTFNWNLNFISENQVYPEFYASPTMGVDTALISFYNTSFNATSVEWDFNNDGVFESQEMNPIYAYMQPGFYSVTMRATGLENELPVTKTITKTDYILVQRGQQGSYCEVAQPAIIGTNIMSFVNGGQQWFKYTVDFEGKLDINLCNSNYPQSAYVYDVFEGCNSNYLYSQQISCNNKYSRQVQVYPGQVVYFLINTNGYIPGVKQITFELNKILPQPGDLCKLPLPISANGIYTISTTPQNSGQSQTKWYEYTALKDGMLELNGCINQDAGGYLNFSMYNDCNNTNSSYVNSRYKQCSSSSTYGSIQTAELKAGQTVLIQVNASVYQQAQWQLNFRDYYYGEICEKPLQAKVGVNTTPAGLNEVYYEYTATANGLVSVSNCQYVLSDSSFYNSGVMIQKACGELGEIISYASGNCGKGAQTAFEVQIGQTYHIQWYSLSSNWDLEFIPNATLPAGYTCANPLIITEDHLTVQPIGNITWLEFTFAQTGTYTLSSDMRNEAAVFLFDACMPISENMKSTVPFVMTDSAIVFWPEAGKTYKMLLVFKEETPQIPYTISKKYISSGTMPSNIVCADALPILTTGQKQTTTVYNNFWYQYNAKANTILHANFNQELFEQLGVSVQLYYGCPSAFDDGDSYDNYYSDCGSNNLQGKSKMIANDTTIYILFRSRDSSVTVNWSLLEYSTSAVGIISMKTQNDVEPAVINNANKTINITVTQSADINTINLDYNLFVGCQMYDAQYNYTICSGNQLSLNNGQKTIILKSADRTVSEAWTIIVTNATYLNNESEILGMNSMYYKNVVINAATKTANIELAWFTPECFNMYPQLSAGAFSSQNIYDICVNMTNPVIYTSIHAENGIDSSYWQINFSKEVLPQGVLCSNPNIGKLGYNNVVFDNTQATSWIKYTVKNNGILDLDACNSYSGISLTVMSDCNTQLPANYEFCGGISYPSKAQLQVVKNQNIYIRVSRLDSTYSNNSELNITEIPDVVTYFAVTPQEVTVFVMDTVTLNMIVYPSQTLMVNIIPSISSGVVTPITINKYSAVQVGDAVITFTTNDGSNLSQTVIVHVKPLPTLVSNIVIPTALALTTGQTVKISPIIAPTNADNKGITWISQNPNIADVDQYGAIKAFSVGTTTISVKSIDGSNITSNICTITVSPVSAESVIVNKTSVTIPVGGFYSNLIATVLPTNATNKNVVWSSNNPSVVSIINNVLYGFAEGTTIVKVALEENTTIFATVNVTVTNTVTVDTSLLLYKIQQVENLIATVSSQGLIGTNTGQYPQTAVDALQAVITSVKNASSSTQAQVDQSIIDIDNAIAQFEASRIGKIDIVYLNIKRDIIYSYKGETKQITPEIYPSNATYIELQWISQNNSVATVSANGLITAISAGETFVNVYAKDGSGKYDSVKVIVENPLLSIYIPQSISVLEGGIIKLEPIKYPADAEILGYTWTSDDETVAVVDAYGNVNGIAEGIATISVFETKSGKTASTVVYVQSQAVNVTSINIIRDSISLVLGGTDVIYPYITPYNATNQGYTWSVSNSKVFVDSSGVITAFDLGIALVTVTSHDGGLTDIIKVIVVPSAAPVVSEIDEVQIESGTSEVLVDLSNYMTDDNTSIEDLIVESVDNQNFNIIVDGNIIVIQPVNPNVPISDTVEVVITDQDNLQTTVFIPVVISVAPNQAPEFIVPNPEYKALDGTNFSAIDLTVLVNDDYTLNTDLEYVITTQSTNFVTFISNGVLQVSRIDANWIGIDSIEVTITDASNLSVSKFITLEVSQLPNQAPIISSIPNQTYIQSTGKYPLLDLKKYITDDYTLARDIEWTYTPNSKLQISINQGVATILSADKNWSGSTTVIFTAFDQDGLSSSTNVIFVQTAGTSSSWVALPKISFTASQTVVGPGAAVTFTSSMSGADSWIWEFEGLNLTPQQRIVPNPTVTYTKGGKYTVKLFAGNTYGDDSVVKVDYITVIGIDQVNPIACIGTPVTLTSTVPASSGYTFEWSTGETTESISVSPMQTSTYILTVKKGWFTYEDQVTLTVPDTLKLPFDMALCNGDSYAISVPGFTQYNWNNEGWIATNSLTVTEAGTTNLLVRDSHGCESSDSFTITELYSVPQVTLGADKNVCQGSSITLTPVITNGTVPYSSKWSSTLTTPTISVNNDGEYWVEITDSHGCTDSDTANVTVLHPYAEPIGVVTFAKDGNGVVIAWERSLGKRTESYEILRETGVANVFESIATVPFDVTQSFFIDQDANVLTKSYSYKLATIDSTCHNIAESSIHTSVHMTNNINLSGKANLNWNKYVGLPIASYVIKKGTTLANLTTVETISGNAAPSWTDPELFVESTIYRIEMVLPQAVETRWALLKSESGPFTLALSNIAEAETSIEDVQSKVLVYPTVATSVINVEFECVIDGVQVQIITSDGDVVYNSGKITENSIQIPVNNLAKGVYTVKAIIADGKIMTSQVIVE